MSRPDNRAQAEQHAADGASSSAPSQEARQARSLWRALLRPESESGDDGLRTVAFAGTVKNAGKTTAIVAALEAAQEDDRTIGLVSAGLDGESTDAIYGTPKPPVPARAETLVVSAERALAASDCEVEILRRLERSGPLGPLVVARVVEAGRVVLGGVRHRRGLRDAIAALRSAGARQVLVDGAFDRIAAADPSLADGLIFSVGSVGRVSAEDVGQNASEWARRIRAPVADDERRKAIDGARDRFLAWSGGGVVPLQLESLLVSDDTLQAQLPPDATALYAPTTITDRALRALRKLAPDLREIVVPDATRLMLSPRELRRLERDDLRVRVLTPIRLLAVTSNPWRPDELPLDADAVAEAIAQAFPETPVFDLHAGRVSVATSRVSV